MDTGVGFINLDDSVKIALNIALAVARENANECYTPSHLLKALLHKDVGLRDFIISIGKDLGYLEEWAPAAARSGPAGEEQQGENQFFHRFILFSARYVFPKRSRAVTSTRRVPAGSGAA